MKIPIFVFCLINISIVCAQQPGSLDTSFGTSGKTLIDFYSRTDYAKDLAILSNGKIIVAGSCYNQGLKDFCVCRLNADGTLDTTFGTSGKVSYNIQATDRDDEVRKVHIQNDGKIIVTGETDLNKFAAIRLEQNGTLDTTFGTGGKITTSFAGTDTRAFDSALDVSGKLVMIGRVATTSSNSDLAIARFNTDGSLDLDFSNDGKVTVDYGNFDDGRAVAIDASGNIYVSGTNNSGVLIAKISTEGTLVNSFGTSGKVFFNIPNIPLIVRSMKMLTNGKLVIGGYASGSSRNTFLASFDLNGTLDTTFGTNGYSIFDIDGNSTDEIRDIIIQSDGKILTAGYILTGGNSYFLLNRFTSNGLLDTTFSGDGIQFVSFGAERSEAHAIKLEGPNKFLVAGEYKSTSDFAVSRHNVDSTMSIANVEGSKYVTYPNPASNYISVSQIEGETASAFAYSLTDLTGKIVKAGVTEYGAKISLENISAGQYILTITSSTGKKNSQKIVKI